MCRRICYAQCYLLASANHSSVLIALHPLQIPLRCSQAWLHFGVYSAVLDQGCNQVCRVAVATAYAGTPGSLGSRHCQWLERLPCQRSATLLAPSNTRLAWSRPPKGHGTLVEMAILAVVVVVVLRRLHQAWGIDLGPDQSSSLMHTKIPEAQPSHRQFRTRQNLFVAALSS